MATRYSIDTIFRAVDRMTGPVKRMQRGIGKFTDKAERGMRSLNRSIGKVIGKMKRAGSTVIKVSAVAIGGLTTAIIGLVREFSKVEDAQAAFQPLLGSAARAKELVDALNDTAATTPFQFETLAGTANQLLPVMNGNIEETIRTMRMLGDTAGGNAQKLESVTRGYTKAMLKGKVDMESLNMIAEAGVPIFQDLADVMGMKVGEKFFKTISAGKVSTEKLNQAFEKMTRSGGKFHNGMEIASKTTSGLWSTLKDNIALTAAELGGALAPTIKGLIKDATVLAQKIRKWAQENRELIGDKFAEYVQFIRDNIGKFIDKALLIGKVIVVVGSLIAVLQVLTGVLTLVNLVMTANPIGLIIVGVAALIAGFTALVVWIDEIHAGFEKMPLAVKILLGPIGLLIKAIKFIKDNWDVVSNAASSLFGGDDGADGTAGANGSGSSGRSIVTPQERVARSVEESRTTNFAEVLIRDTTGKAEMTKGGGRKGPIMLQHSGAF